MPTKKLKVLIADDEAHCRMLMKAVIASMNCEVVAEAKTGVEALDFYKKFKPHMTLLDINMPIMTGDEVLAEILTLNPDAFVIMLTSVADMETVDTCISLGAANYIRKDTSIEEIKALIKESWRTSVQERAGKS
ncbi:MAG: response regulator transcription factor [Acidobacteriota bacterium]